MSSDLVLPVWSYMYNLSLARSQNLCIYSSVGSGEPNACVIILANVRTGLISKDAIKHLVFCFIIDNTTCDSHIDLP